MAYTIDTQSSGGSIQRYTDTHTGSDSVSVDISSTNVTSTNFTSTTNNNNNAPVEDVEIDLDSSSQKNLEAAKSVDVSSSANNQLSESDVSIDPNSNRSQNSLSNGKEVDVDSFDTSQHSSSDSKNASTSSTVPSSTEKSGELETKNSNKDTNSNLNSNGANGGSGMAGTGGTATTPNLNSGSPSANGAGLTTYDSTSDNSSNQSSDSDMTVNETPSGITSPYVSITDMDFDNLSDEDLFLMLFYYGKEDLELLRGKLTQEQYDAFIEKLKKYYNSMYTNLDYSLNGDGSEGSMSSSEILAELKKASEEMSKLDSSEISDYIANNNILSQCGITSLEDLNSLIEVSSAQIEQYSALFDVVKNNMDSLSEDYLFLLQGYEDYEIPNTFADMPATGNTSFLTDLPDAVIKKSKNDDGNIITDGDTIYFTMKNENGDLVGIDISEDYETLHNMGFRDEDLMSIFRGDKSYDELVAEIEQENGDRYQELLASSYLSSYYPDFETILASYNEKNGTEYTFENADALKELINQKSDELKKIYDQMNDIDGHEAQCTLKIIEILKNKPLIGDRADFNTIENTAVAWKYTDENGYEHYVYENPYQGYYEYSSDTTVYTPVSYKELYGDSESYKALKESLVSEDRDPLFGDPYTALVWSDDDAQQKMIDSLTKLNESCKNNRSSDLTKKVNDLKEEIEGLKDFETYLGDAEASIPSVEVHSIKEIDDNLESINSRLDELREKRNSVNESSAMKKMITALQNGSNFETVSQMGAAWKYTDENGEEHLVYQQPAYDTYGSVTDDTIYGLDGNTYTKITYEELYGDTDLYKELKNMLTEKEVSHIFADSTTELGWTGTEEQTKFLAKIEEQCKSDSKEMEKVNSEIEELVGQKNQLKSMKEKTLSQTDYYSNNIHNYTIKSDFSENCNYNPAKAESALAHATDSSIKDNNTTAYAYNNGFMSSKVSQEDLGAILVAVANGEASLNGNYLTYNGVTVQLLCDDSGDTIEQYSKWMPYLNDQEKEVLNYILNQEGGQAAYEYLRDKKEENVLADQLDDRWLSHKTAEDQEWATEHPYLASVASVFVTPFEGMGAAYNSWKSGLTGEEIRRCDVYSSGDVYRSTVSSNIREKYGEGWAFVYDTGMSMADSALLIGVTALTGPAAAPIFAAGLMGSRVYVSTLNDALDRGLDDWQAIGLATSSAAVETAMESWAVSHLFKLDSVLGDGAVNLATKIGGKFSNPEVATKICNVTFTALSQALVEGDEEFCTELANYGLDALIAGDKSHYVESRNHYAELGYNDDQINTLITRDVIYQSLQAWAGGAASGLFFGAGAGFHVNVQTNAAIANNVYGDLFEGSNNVFGDTLLAVNDQNNIETDIERLHKIEAIANKFGFSYIDSRIAKSGTTTGTNSGVQAIMNSGVNLAKLDRTLGITIESKNTVDALVERADKITDIFSNSQKLESLNLSDADIIDAMKCLDSSQQELIFSKYGYKSGSFEGIQRMASSGVDFKVLDAKLGISIESTDSFNEYLERADKIIELLNDSKQSKDFNLTDEDIAHVLSVLDVNQQSFVLENLVQEANDFNNVLSYLNDTQISELMDSVFNKMLRGEKISSATYDMIFNSSVFSADSDFAKNYLHDWLARNVSVEVADLVSSRYEAARTSTANNEFMKNLFSFCDHTEAHTLQVAFLSVQSALQINQASENAENYAALSEQRIKELFVTGIMHDLGMGNLEDGIHIKMGLDAEGNIIYKTVPLQEYLSTLSEEDIAKGKIGDTVRSLHTFNSALDILGMRDLLEKAGLNPDRMALIAFSHSKSNSGIASLISQADFSLGIRMIEAGAQAKGVTFNIDSGMSQYGTEIGIGKDTSNLAETSPQKGLGKKPGNVKVVELDEQTFGELSTSGFALRVGDAYVSKAKIQLETPIQWTYKGVTYTANYAVLTQTGKYMLYDTSTSEIFEGMPEDIKSDNCETVDPNAFIYAELVDGELVPCVREDGVLKAGTFEKDESGSYVIADSYDENNGPFMSTMGKAKVERKGTKTDSESGITYIRDAKDGSLREATAEEAASKVENVEYIITYNTDTKSGGFIYVPKGSDGVEYYYAEVPSTSSDHWSYRREGDTYYSYDSENGERVISKGEYEAVVGVPLKKSTGQFLAGESNVTYTFEYGTFESKSTGETTKGLISTYKVGNLEEFTYNAISKGIEERVGEVGGAHNINRIVNVEFSEAEFSEHFEIVENGEGQKVVIPRDSYAEAYVKKIINLRANFKSIVFALNGYDVGRFVDFSGNSLANMILNSNSTTDIEYIMSNLNEDTQKNVVNEIVQRLTNGETINSESLDNFIASLDSEQKISFFNNLIHELENGQNVDSEVLLEVVKQLDTLDALGADSYVFETLIRNLDDTQISGLMDNVYERLLQGETISSATYDMIFNSSVFSADSDFAKNYLHDWLARNVSVEVADLVSSRYEAARTSTANNEFMKNLFSFCDHTEAHTLQVAFLSVQSALQINQASENAENYAALSEQRIKELFVTGIMHDLGMGNLEDGIHIKMGLDAEGNIIYKTVPLQEYLSTLSEEDIAKGKIGDTVRSLHTFNSALDILGMRDLLEKAGLNPDRMALIAFSHSKSNSGIASLISQADFSLGIRMIEAGAQAKGVTFNIDSGMSQYGTEIGIGKDTSNLAETSPQKGLGKKPGNVKVVELDEQTFGELSTSGFALRVGDAYVSKAKIQLETPIQWTYKGVTYTANYAVLTQTGKYMLYDTSTSEIFEGMPEDIKSDNCETVDPNAFIYAELVDGELVPCVREDGVLKAGTFEKDESGSYVIADSYDENNGPFMSTMGKAKVERKGTKTDSESGITYIRDAKDGSLREATAEEAASKVENVEYIITYNTDTKSGGFIYVPKGSDGVEYYYAEVPSTSSDHWSYRREGDTYYSYDSENGERVISKGEYEAVVGVPLKKSTGQFLAGESNVTYTFEYGTFESKSTGETTKGLISTYKVGNLEEFTYNAISKGIEERVGEVGGAHNINRIVNVEFSEAEFSEHFEIVENGEGQKVVIPRDSYAEAYVKKIINLRANFKSIVFALNGYDVDVFSETNGDISIDKGGPSLDSDSSDKKAEGPYASSRTSLSTTDSSPVMIDPDIDSSGAKSGKTDMFIAPNPSGMRVNPDSAMSMLWSYYRESSKQPSLSKVTDIRDSDTSSTKLETSSKTETAPPHSYFGIRYDAFGSRSKSPNKRYYKTDYLAGETAPLRTVAETQQLVAATHELTQEQKSLFIKMYAYLAGAPMLKGLSFDEMQQQLDGYFKSEVVDKSDVGIRMDTDVLLKCLESGYVKNFFEVDSSYAGASKAQRAGVEENLFGIAQDTAYADRPVYGMLLPSSEDLDRQNKYILEGPGDYLGNEAPKCVIIYDKLAIESCSTCTVGDSLDYEGMLSPSPLANPRIKGAHSFELFKTDDSIKNMTLESITGGNNDTYVEVQIHGQEAHQFNSNTVKEIVFYETPSDSLIATLEEKGFKWRVIDQSTTE